MQVVTDLNAVAEALGTAPPDDKLLIQCKADLVPFWSIHLYFYINGVQLTPIHSDQVNEICSWAAEQLVGPPLVASLD